MDAYTSGPWINDGDTISARVDHQNSDTYIAPICEIDTDWSPDIARANARLIASAPDLLAALQMALDASQNCIADRSWEDAAIAAIAKATGEQS